jgi:hypothetical protein
MSDLNRSVVQPEAKLYDLLYELRNSLIAISEALDAPHKTFVPIVSRSDNDVKNRWRAQYVVTDSQGYIHETIAAYGASPAEAVKNFDRAWCDEKIR